LRAWPEQTQLEDLSDASFFGKLLVLPANVSLDWKVFARHKHSSLFGLIVSNEEKSFITLTPGHYKTIFVFFSATDAAAK
jgi:hypothetical protein